MSQFSTYFNILCLSLFLEEPCELLVVYRCVVVHIGRAEPLYLPLREVLLRDEVVQTH